MIRTKFCPPDIELFRKNFEEEELGDFQSHIDNKSFFKNISVCISYKNNIIGGYLIRTYSINKLIKDLKYIDKNEDTLEFFNIFVDNDFLEKYKNKKGIYSAFIFVDKNYRNNGISKKLISYSKSLGDYVFGISLKEKTDDFWISKQKRIKIAEYKEIESIYTYVITASKIKTK